MTNHVSANSSSIRFVFLLAQDDTKTRGNNRKVNGLQAIRPSRPLLRVQLAKEEVLVHENHEVSYLGGTSCIYSMLASGGLSKCFQCNCVVDSTIKKKLFVIPYESEDCFVYHCDCRVCLETQSSVGSRTSLFCSDVVAFNHFPFYTQRKSERVTSPGKKRAGGGRFTQHFVEHCAILVCSSHSVDMGGVACGEKKPRFQLQWVVPVQREVGTQHTQIQLGWSLTPLPSCRFVFLLLHTVPASDVSGSIR